MTNEEAINTLKNLKSYYNDKSEYCEDGYVGFDNEDIEALDMAIKALKQQPIDKSAMMYEIYMQGVNMSGEYQGCWVCFKDIEKIVDKYMSESEDKG